MPFLGALLGGLGTAAGSAAIGMGLGAYNDERQLKQQHKLSAQQLKYQKELNDYNQKLAYEMWERTNYKAQLEKIKEAGLNPAMLYGMGGGGGGTMGNAGGSISGGSAAGHSGETGMGIQLELLKAQKENIEADTAQKEAVTEKTAGVDTKLAKVNIDLAKLERQIKSESADAAAGIIETAYQKALEELHIAKNRSEISARTMETEIERTGAELAQIYLRNNQIKSQTNLTDEQIKEVVQSVQTQIKQLQQGDEHIKIQQIRNELIKTGIWVGAGTQVIGDLVSILKTPAKVVETVTEQFNDGHGNKTTVTTPKYKR